MIRLKFIGWTSVDKNVHCMYLFLLAVHGLLLIVQCWDVLVEQEEKVDPTQLKQYFRSGLTKNLLCLFCFVCIFPELVELRGAFCVKWQELRTDKEKNKIPP